jgi:hypothetical protein
VDATTRSMMSTVTTVLNWIIGAIVTLSLGRNDKKYEW